VQADGFVNPCEWNMATKLVALSAGQASTGTDLVLMFGSRTTLHLQDSSHILSQPTKDGRSPVVLAGIWSPATIPAPNGKSLIPLPGGGGFHPLRLTGKDAAGANYEIVVPHDRVLDFHIQSPDVSLRDATGATLPGNQQHTPFQHNSSDPNPKTFTYTVTGKMQ
jgi:hypothetical protein